MYNLEALYVKCRELQLILSVTVSVVFSAAIVINCLLRVLILQCSAIIKWGVSSLHQLILSRHGGNSVCVCVHDLVSFYFGC